MISEDIICYQSITALQNAFFYYVRFLSILKKVSKYEKIIL